MRWTRGVLSLFLSGLLSSLSWGQLPPRAVTATVTWTEPTTDCQGGALAPGELLGYRLYVAEAPIPDNWGTDPCTDLLPVSGATLLADETALPAPLQVQTVAYVPAAKRGTAYFRLSAVGVGGRESPLSNQVAVEYDVRPHPHSVIISIGP